MTATSQKETTEETKTTKVREISFDGLMKLSDVVLVTGLSRVTLWRLEREGKFPQSVQVSPGRVAKIGREVKEFIDSRPRVNLEQPETAGAT